MPDDAKALEILDGYLAQLQAGARPDRDSVLGHCPELASALDCLEALERIAPAAAMQDGGAAESVAMSPEATPLPQAAPRDFGNYELLEEIGRGGMGVVYKARQKELDRIVAVKMILASHQVAPEVVKRFQAEARAAAKLRHPHIVPIHEVGQVHGQHYFVMELIDGTSLAEQIARGGCDVAEAVRIIAAVARAVDQMHQQGIIHRDLKPANVLLDRQGHPYLADFGLAKIFAPGPELTASGVIAGTPSYMAPEQASGHAHDVGPAADVYALGAMLYEMLTGQPPFRNENPLDTLLEVLSVAPPLPRKLNPRIQYGLELICLKCLSKLPQNRYSSAAALADDLDRFVRGEPLAVRSPHLGQRLRGWTHRQPALAYRLAGLGLFDAVGWVNYWFGVINLGFQLRMTLLLLVWAAASIVCQQFLESRRWSFPARYVWGSLDSLLLLAALLLGDGAASSLLVGYPLLIAGAGLWFRQRMVWFVTGLSLASYALLTLDFYFRRPELQQHFNAGVDRHVIFALAMLIEGAMVAYLVHRLRTLTRFYGDGDKGRLD
jgi:eukaryotic-like serine/threonine-protein kinase